MEPKIKSVKEELHQIREIKPLVQKKTAIADGEEEQKSRENAGQRFNIMAKDVRKYGPTIGCPGCAAVIDKLASQNHTEPCRAKFHKIIPEIFEK